MEEQRLRREAIQAAAARVYLERGFAVSPWIASAAAATLAASAFDVLPVSNDAHAMQYAAYLAGRSSQPSPAAFTFNHGNVVNGSAGPSGVSSSSYASASVGLSASAVSAPQPLRPLNGRIGEDDDPDAMLRPETPPNAAVAAAAAAVPAAPVAPIGAAAAQAPRGLLAFIAMDDARLALKIVAVTLLLCQDGGPHRIAALSSLAIFGFCLHLYMNYRVRIAAAAAAATPRDANGEVSPASNDDENAELPPLRMRGLVEGGIAPGGGWATDLSYLLVAFVASLLPAWQPQPAFDPQAVARRQQLEHRRREARAAAVAARVSQAAVKDEEIEDFGEGLEEDVRDTALVRGHLHQE